MAVFTAIFSTKYISLFLTKQKGLIAQLQIVEASKVFIADAKKD